MAAPMANLGLTRYEHDSTIKCTLATGRRRILACKPSETALSWQPRCGATIPLEAR